MSDSKFNQNKPILFSQEPGLYDYWLLFYGSKRHIAEMIVLVVLIAAGYLYFANPVYEVDTVLQLEDNSNVLGDLEKLSTLVGGDSSKINGEIELLQSRSILLSVVNELGLDNIVSHAGWAAINAAWWKLNGRKLAVEIKKLMVPTSMLGTPFQVDVVTEKDFLIRDDDGQLLLRGTLGRLSSAHGISVLLASDSLLPGDRFTITKLRPFDAINALHNRLIVNEKGKDSNLIRVACRHTDAFMARQIVDSIASHYVRQNVQRHAEEASLSIAFLEQQLPIVRSQLEKAETALNTFRKNNQSIDLTEESKSLLEQTVSIQQEISQTKVKRSELQQRFMPSHPMIRALDARMQQLQKEMQVLEEKTARRPKTEQQVIGLMREQRVKSDVYTYLLNKLQELRVVQAGTVGNVRVIDSGIIPSRPIAPKKLAIMTGAVLMGLFLGILWVFFRHTFRNVATDPQEIEQQLGISVSACIPHSPQQYEVDRKKKKWRRSSSDHQQSDRLFLLTNDDQHDPAIESMLSLRTNLHFLFSGKKGNVIVLSGPSASLGKSFLSANMCALLAESDDLRVLVIDGDLRRGHLHDYFGLVQRSPGLSEAISGQTRWQDCIRQSSISGLDILTTGKLPPNPANLLMSKRFEEIISETSYSYDIVWIDTPPVLVATDAALIGKYSDLFLLLLRFGINPYEEIRESVRRLNQAGIEVDSMILNDVRLDELRYGYHYGRYYGTYYKYQKDNKTS